MPTVISHGLVGAVFGKFFTRSSSLKFLSLSVICSVLPDIDIIPMSLGVPYEHMFGHRGFSHSVFFALLTALAVVLIGFREVKINSKDWWKYVVCFLLIGLSHGILDAMTSGGQGIGFFMPFDSTRYFFHYRPIRVSPLSLTRFFGSEGQRIIISELVWVWLPAIVALLTIRSIRSGRKVGAAAEKSPDGDKTKTPLR
jgi:inner membrane protein